MSITFEPNTLLCAVVEYLKASEHIYDPVDTRPEQNIMASVPGLPEDFVGPKEEEIIALCRQEKAQGRRILLLCQQTDTLDIQPEWKAMLEAVGLKVAILRAAPDSRERWVAQQVKAGVDVIITHPRKVETGIDLLDFPTIVWMAIDYSVYTVLQASRRSWRIGQTQPVKVYYFAYEETIQEDALRLVAAKVAAALRVNGDTIGDDGLADLDELASGDLVATLAKIVTGEAQIEARSLQQAFAEANASLRQANVLIGEYSVVDDSEDDEPLADPEPVPQQSALSDLTPLNLPQEVANDHSGNGQHPARQPFPFTNGQAKAHDAAASAHLNGQATGSSVPVATDQPLKVKPSSPPPAPRPRLLLSQLSN